MTPAENALSTIAVIGTGVIGTSWCAAFLAHGLDVVASDPAPDAENLLRREVARLWPTMERLGLAHGSSLERLTFTDDVQEAAAAADHLQENGPERLDVKQRLYALLDEAARPEVVLASSSSGLLASDIQGACAREPGRVLIGHPFNPPHMIPLVEVVPGAVTSEQSVERAMAFYTAIGKRPIRLRQELRGHVANRLQAALWREAYSLVERGAATVSDIDAAIAWGPGLRWAVLGPLANQHLSGGEGGLRHVLEHLGPPMVDIWADLGQPTLTAGLIDLLVDGVDDELAGRDRADLEAQRDAALDLVLRAKAGSGLP